VRRLQSYTSLPAAGGQGPALSGLAKKLRLKPADRVAILNPPPGYLAQLAPAPADLHLQLGPDQLYDAVQLFVSSIQELRTLGPVAIRSVKPAGVLWIACPRGGPEGAASDLPPTPMWTQRDVVGELTGETGYKPVAFMTIDDTWTALRFKHP
jgi:hypothetical protein